MMIWVFFLPCSIGGINQCFGRAYWLHLQGTLPYITVRVEAVSYSKRLGNTNITWHRKLGNLQSFPVFPQSTRSHATAIQHNK